MSLDLSKLSSKELKELLAKKERRRTPGGTEKP